MTQGESAELDALWNAALDHHQAGRLAEAIDLYDRLTDAVSGADFVYANRGAAYLALNRHEAALADFDRAIALQPASVEALLGRVGALLALAQPDRAAKSAWAVVSMRPDLANGHYALALALSALGRHEEAIEGFDDAVALAPGLVDAHLHRGGALHALGRLDQALEAYDRVVTLSPGLEQGHYNRARTLADLDRPAEALAAYDRAIALRPDNPDSHLNRGVALEGVGDWPAAILAYEQAIKLNPEHSQAQANLAMARLALGDFRTGFAFAELRKQTRVAYGLRSFDRPEWRGDSPIEGKVLLITAEEGLGDEMMYCRYLDRVRAAGARPILVSHPPLKALLSQSFPDITVLADGEPLPPFDLHAALLSLPADFGADFNSIPSRFPYLRADPTRIEAWRRRLGDNGFKIGVAWHCSRRGAITGKSFPLTALAPIAELSGVRLISLQTDEGSEQAKVGAVRVETLGDDFDAGPGGFLDSAAVMESLDLVITPDTALAHLAGAMDRPIWMALKFSAEWRWLVERADTPWYPSMRLFRQAQRGDWASVFAAMREDLAIRLSP